MMNRRSFIKRSLAAAAAMAVPQTLYRAVEHSPAVTNVLNAFPIKFNLEENFTVTFWTKKYDEWIHVAMTKDQDNVNVFVNGVTQTIDPSKIEIAQKAGEFEGLISNVNVFDRELSQFAVKDIEHIQRRVVETSKSHMHFKEGDIIFANNA